MLEQIATGSVQKRPNRKRERAVEVMLDLILETGAMPSVEEVTAAADISRRSFFRFFPRESIRILEVNRLMRERLFSQFTLPEADHDRSAAETLRLFVELKSQVDEQRMPLRKLAEAAKDASPEVGEFLRLSFSEWTRYLEELFSPHLEDRSDRREVLKHIHFNTSWSVWSILRLDLGLSIKESQAFVQRQVLAMLEVGCSD